MAMGKLSSGEYFVLGKCDSYVQSVTAVFIEQKRQKGNFPKLEKKKKK